MSYSVEAVPSFLKEAKKLIKKYKSLKSELIVLFDLLKENPTHGVSVGNNCYKIRLSIASKGKGKSGGARIITNIVIKDKIVYLLSIYDKSEKANLSNNELEELLKNIKD